MDYARKADGPLREAHCLAHKGSVEIALGELQQARKDLEAALKVYEELNIPRGCIGVWVNLARLPDTEPDQALELLQAALAESEKFHLKPEKVLAHQELSLKFKAEGEYKAALKHLEHSFEIEKKYPFGKCRTACQIITDYAPGCAGKGSG